MTQSRRRFQRVALFVVVGGWIISGGPRVFNFPPAIPEAEAAIGVGTVRSAVDDNTATLDITSVGISGANRALLVGVCFNNNDNQSPTSVVIDPNGGNETALAWLNNAAGIVGGDDGHCTIWGVKNPPTGTFTVRVTLGQTTRASEALVVGAWPLTGVDHQMGFAGSKARDEHHGGPSQSDQQAVRTGHVGDRVGRVAQILARRPGEMQIDGVLGQHAHQRQKQDGERLGNVALGQLRPPRDQCGGTQDGDPRQDGRRFVGQIDRHLVRCNPGNGHQSSPG